MTPLRYLTPFAFLALLPIGGWLGGAWTFMAAAATPVCLASLDGVFGEDEEHAASGGTLPRWMPRFYVLLQLAATGWAAWWVSQSSAASIEVIGMTLSTGVLTGVFGFVAAHEMIHSRDPGERALGLTLLGTVLYMHFRIAHVYGHHSRAATLDDPASARLGESLYAFLVRSIGGQFREAWRFDRRRSGGKRMLLYLAIESAFLLAVGLASWRALAFLLAVAGIAVSLLESFNYVAHYGLSRRLRADGRPEPLSACHSWNSGRRMNNASLFNMGRHSDHHRHMMRSYEALEPLDGAAELPSGYAAALLTALIPPLWRRTMDHRAQSVMSGSYRGTP